MNKTFLTLALTAAAINASAQIAEVSAPIPLLRGTESEMYYPVLSTDGSQMVFSDANHSNLRVYDFKDNVTTKITATPREAITAKVSSDGKVTFETTNTNSTQATVDGSVLIIKNNGKTVKCTPVECYAGYCWPSVSPDGKKVMFVAAGKGIVVTDLNGNILSRPGNKRLEAPVWFGNNHIVAMNTTDDGHQLSSSQIIMLTVDGSESQQLTSPESMTMFPSASIDASRIVYNTIDGRLYQMNVKLK